MQFFTILQHFTRFQLTACLRGSSALAGLLVHSGGAIGMISGDIHVERRAVFLPLLNSLASYSCVGLHSVGRLAERCVATNCGEKQLVKTVMFMLI